MWRLGLCLLACTRLTHLLVGLCAVFAHRKAPATFEPQRALTLPTAPPDGPTAARGGYFSSGICLPQCDARPCLRGSRTGRRFCARAGQKREREHRAASVLPHHCSSSVQPHDAHCPSAHFSVVHHWRGADAQRDDSCLSPPPSGQLRFSYTVGLQNVNERGLLRAQIPAKNVMVKVSPLC